MFGLCFILICLQIFISFWFLQCPVGCSVAYCLGCMYLCFFIFFRIDFSSRNTDMISVISNLFRFVLWQHILKNVLCALKKSVHYTIVGWGVYQISVRYDCFMVVIAYISLVIFYLEFLFYKNYCWAILSFSFVSLCVIYLKPFYYYIHACNCYIFIMDWCFYHYVIS